MVNAQHLVSLVRASATLVNDELLERPGDPSREASSPPTALEGGGCQSRLKILIHRS
jgi:hypothetical protein